ncbi:prenyltransferase/squalene oxidase repeat-containing protein [Streptomyces violens]|uniref:prenyltransferase/squalene oxidase repeat-containing protein n=1 Tax=Streptomyces violens TaxID=66377 RepID=UPI00068C9E38|nr:prenyltransferase/squalene oxidase repeat-containing protein [Streptomyces violens]
MAITARSLAAPARRCAAALAAAVLCAAAAPAAFAADPAPAASPKLPKGLYGSTDPKYDGVWRQSLALLAQDTTGVRPADSAVDWLAGQQCADGAFTAYRAAPKQPCDAKTMRDTNQTAAAVQALAAVGGHADAVREGVSWLKSAQNDDGGWGSATGAPSDANSTSVVIGALAATGTKPESVTAKKGGRTPYEGLLAFRLGCDVAEKDRGAFAFQAKDGKLAANEDATAAAVLGALGKGFVVEPGAHAPEKTSCEEAAKDAGGAAGGAADQLGAVLDAHGHHLMSAMPGAESQADVGNTADAVVALAAAGRADAAKQSLSWLRGHSAAWAKQSGPAAYAQLILAAHATGGDPRDFGGTDLVTKLNATGPKPASAASDQQADKEQKQDEGGVSVWWVVLVGLAAGAGIGFLLSGRRKQNQL